MHTRPVLAGLFAALLPALAAPAQQLFFAQNNDTTYNNTAVGFPAVVMAFRFTAPANATIAAAQIFTGNQPPAAHTLELHAHNAGTGLPGTLLGPAGSWSTLHARCWQGATLQPVGLVGGQDYWLLWRVTGMFHQHSESASNAGNTLSEVRISADGVSWGAAVMSAAKFRLFTPSTSGPIQAFGTAKPGQYGNPTIGVSGWPTLGSPVDVWVDSAGRPGPAFLLIGQPIPAGLVFPFGTAWCTAEVALFYPTLLHTSPTSGARSHTFFVPNLPIAAGFPLTFQWAVIDPLAADGIAHTGAVTATPL